MTDYVTDKGNLWKGINEFIEEINDYNNQILSGKHFIYKTPKNTLISAYPIIFINPTQNYSPSFPYTSNLHFTSQTLYKNPSTLHSKYLTPYKIHYKNLCNTLTPTFTIQNIMTQKP